MNRVDNEYNQPLESSAMLYHRALMRDAFWMMVVDVVAIALSLILGNLILYLINGISFSITNGWLIIPLWLAIALVAKLFPGWGMGAVDEMRLIQKMLFVMFASVLVVSFFTRNEIASSRIVFLFTYISGILLIPFGRACLRGFLSKRNRWGVSVAIYGGADDVADFIGLLESDLKLGYIPTSIFLSDVEKPDEIGQIPVRGGIDQACQQASIAIVLQDSLSKEDFHLILSSSAEIYRRLVIIPELLSAPSLWVKPIDFEGVLGLEVTRNLLSPVVMGSKIFSDYFFVLITMPIWICLIVLLTLLIWLEDRSNPFFLQERVGKKGRLFKAIKFRTMVPRAEEVLQSALEQDEALRIEWETHFKLRKDPRITKIGKLLRITSLDELPQLFNVLNGTMSVVGPRPLPTYHFEELPKSVRLLRNQVKPGITGMWQVSGRSEAGTAGMEKWDPYYVRNWSIWLDVVILMRTIRAVLFAKGAY
jgi:Undecaprenyl-phosphate galactose phosphotransferase WbaP